MRLAATILTACLLGLAAEGVQAQDTQKQPSKAEAAQAGFDRYFEDKTMRFDFYHCGDAAREEYFFDEVREEPYWAGSKVSLVDDTGYGVQLLKVFDKESGRLIYSRSYCTLFNEWQTTAEAQNVRKAMPESVVFPYPKGPVRIELHARSREGVMEKKFEQDSPRTRGVHRRREIEVRAGVPHLRRGAAQLLALQGGGRALQHTRRVGPVDGVGRDDPGRARLAQHRNKGPILHFRLGALPDDRGFSGAARHRRTRPL